MERSQTDTRRMRRNHNYKRIRIRPVILVATERTQTTTTPCRIGCIPHTRRCILIMAISILSLAPMFLASLPTRSHHRLLLLSLLQEEEETEVFLSTENIDNPYKHATKGGNNNTSSTWNNMTVDKKNPNKPSLLTIFYNLYLPKSNDTLATNGTTTTTTPTTIMKEIVQDQIHQIGASCHKYSNHQNKHCVLRYVSIGVRAEDDTIQEYCRPYQPHLTCVPEAHHEEGFEEVTLHRLWKHCQDIVNPSKERVVYLHNKGSYNAEKPLVREGNRAERCQSTCPFSFV